MQSGCGLVPVPARTNSRDGAPGHFPLMRGLLAARAAHSRFWRRITVTLRWNGPRALNVSGMLPIAVIVASIDG